MSTSNGGHLNSTRERIHHLRYHCEGGRRSRDEGSAAEHVDRLAFLGGRARQNAPSCALAKQLFDTVRQVFHRGRADRSEKRRGSRALVVSEAQLMVQGNLFMK